MSRDLQPAPPHSIRVIGAPQRVRDASREDFHRPDALTVETIGNGHVPPACQHEIETFDPSSDWLFHGWKAGVYNADSSPSALSMLDRSHTNVSIPYDADELSTFEYRHQDKNAVYGGMLFRHFGHFLIESTTRLWWPLREQFDGPIIFQTVGHRSDMPPFAERFFTLLGIRDRVILTGTRGYSFNKIMVPERSLAIRKYWHPLFHEPFRHIGGRVEQSWRPLSHCENGDALYLSRTQYQFRRSIGEKRLERLFRDNGFTIAHPETIPLEEQIFLARRHRTIAGIQGSALHNMLFSDMPKEAIYISRDYQINRNFFMIDAMMQNQATYIYNGLARDALVERSERSVIAQQYKENTTLDLDKITWALAQLGIE